MKPKTFINLWEKDDRVIVKTRGEISEFEYPWYFVLRLEDAKRPEIKRNLIDIKENYKLIEKFEKQGKWLKIYCPYLNRDRVIEYIKSLGIQTYEADLKLWQRYLTDEDIELELDQKILYFDIETDDLKNGINPGDEQITLIGAIGSDGKEYQFFSTTDERRLLKKFVKLVDKYDIVSGWNSEGFDLVAIAKRCKMYHIDFGCWASEWSKHDMGGLDNVRKFGKYRARPQTFNHIDMMMKVKEMHYRDTELIKKVRSFSLNAVSKVILGEEKVDLGAESTYSLARTKPDLFKKYNMQDVRLLVKLDAKLNVIQQKLIEHHVCNARLNDYTSHGKIDPYALRAARKMGEHLPTRPDKEIYEEELKDIDPDVREDSDRGVKAKGDYTGGYVFEPDKGMHKDIYVFDFQSLYPSIIKTFNVSLDSYLGTRGSNPEARGITLPIKEKSKRAIFDGSRKGIIPSIIQNVLDQRNKIRFEVMKKLDKDNPAQAGDYWNWHYRQYAFKVLANSMYGIMGASFSRYFKRELAEGITLTGQYLIKSMWKWMEDQGHKPIYGDSDSLFVHIEGNPDIPAMNKEMKTYLDNKLRKFGIKESCLQMDFEKKFDRFILVAKKKYIGIAKDGEMKITGLEMKKRDTLPLAEKLQRKILDYLLKDENPSFEKIVKIVKRLRERVFQHELEKEDLIYQKRLSREVEGYGREMKDKNGGPKFNKNGEVRRVPIPAHVKVATELKRRVEENGEDKLKNLNLYSAGCYIPYIIVESKPIKAIYAEDFEGHYDEQYYWEAVFGPTERILEVVFPHYDWAVLAKQELSMLF